MNFLLELIEKPWLAIILAIVIILIVREIVTWYWKINAIIYMQEQQTDLLESINEELIRINKDSIDK